MRVCVRACVCVRVLWAGRETGRLLFWRSSCQSPSGRTCPSHHSAGELPLRTTVPFQIWSLRPCYSLIQQRSDVLNIILGPEDTPMGRKEKTHSFGLRRCPSSRDAPANAGDAGPTTGWGRPHTPRGKRRPRSEACPPRPESSAHSCNWRTPGTATKTQHSPDK